MYINTFWQTFNTHTDTHIYTFRGIRSYINSCNLIYTFVIGTSLIPLFLKISFMA